MKTSRRSVFQAHPCREKIFGRVHKSFPMISNILQIGLHSLMLTKNSRRSCAQEAGWEAV